MKKAIASFTVIVYLVFACGIMVNFHYCMDRYDSFSLYQPSKDVCPTCGMHAKQHGCCHNETKIVKLQDSYQNSSLLFSLKNIQPAFIVPSQFFSASLAAEEIALNRTTHSPPLMQQDANIQNCVFRI